MTFVGKILVIVILVFSMFFLALSTVVFTTATNWREQSQKNQEAITALNTKLGTVTAEAEARTKDLEDAKASYETQVKKFQQDIAALQDDIGRFQKQYQDATTKLETAQEAAKTALAEAEARRQETTQLRELLANVQREANAYKERQRELNQRIFELTRINEDANNKNRALRERVATLVSHIRQIGGNPEAAAPGRTEPPPTLRGEITRVNATNSRVELSIGSDDGLLAGHTLQVFRTNPQPDYLGVVEILATEPDQSVARVVRLNQGKKLQEGDRVAPQIRPRG